MIIPDWLGFTAVVCIGLLFLTLLLNPNMWKPKKVDPNQDAINIGRTVQKLWDQLNGK